MILGSQATAGSSATSSRALDRGLVADSVICLAALIALAGVMYHGVFRYRPTAADVAAVTVARVDRLSGAVRLRAARRLVWNVMHSGDSVAAGDSVFVEPNAEAVFVFDDGTRLDVDESSLLVFAGPPTRGAPEPGVHLRQGGLVSHTGDRGLRIATARGALTAGGDAQVRVRTRDDVTRLDVISGQAQLAGGLAAGPAERMTMTKTGVSTRRLHVQLDAPARGAHVPLTGSEARVEFLWRAGTGADDLLELAADSAFSEVIHRAQPGGSRVELTLRQAGVFFWRVTRATDAGQQVSEERRLVVLERRPPIPLRPWAGEVVFATEGGGVDFFWQGIDASRHYRVEVRAIDAAARSVIDAEVKATAYLHQGALPEGGYRWRVRATDRAAAEVPPSSWVPFRLVRNPLPQTPHLLDPKLEVGPTSPRAPPGTQGSWLRQLLIGVAHAAATERSASHVLRWRRVPGAQRYEVEIAGAPEFVEIVHQAAVPKTYYRWRPPTGARDYWFRVRSIDAQGRASPFSEAKLLPAFAVAPAVIAPASGALFAWKAAAPTIRLRWRPSEVAAAYIVQVASSASFTSPALSREVRGESALEWRPPEPGSFFWRVQVIDVNGGASPFSPAQRFEVKAAAPAISSPGADATVALEAAGASLRVRWSPRPVARYELQVARSESFDNLLQRRETGASEATVRLARAGRYYLRVRGIGHDDTPTAWSAPRPVLVQRLTLTLLAPVTGDELTGVGETGEVSFSWVPLEQAARYRVVLGATEAAGEAPIPEATGASSVTVTGVPAGLYAWSVEALDDAGEVITSSDSRSFSLVLSAPELAVVPASAPASAPAEAVAPQTTGAQVQVSPLATGWRLGPRLGIDYNLGAVIAPRVEVELLYRLPLWERQLALALSPGYAVAGLSVEDEASGLRASSMVHRFPIRLSGSYGWSFDDWRLSAGGGVTFEPFLVTSTVDGGPTRSASGVVVGPTLLLQGGYAVGPGALQLGAALSYLSHHDGVFEIGGPNLCACAGYRWRLGT